MPVVSLRVVTYLVCYVRRVLLESIDVIKTHCAFRFNRKGFKCPNKACVTLRLTSELSFKLSHEDLPPFDMGVPAGTVNYQRPGRFSKVPKSFRTRKAVAESQIL